MKRHSEENFFKRNFQTIAKAGIILIPTIYTTLFLGSMWDPYGNVDKLPVAVVNEDHAVEYQGKTLSVGEELSEKLLEKNALDFHFVDGTAAKAGLEDGTYYMVITIPQNFSSNAATLLEEHPQKMELRYATNPGTNYIASKMSESALGKIEKEVSASVTESYAEALFEQFDEIGDGFTVAADGALQIKDGSVKLKDGNTTITENLQRLAESTLTFKNGAESLESGLYDYTNGVSQVNDGVKELREGIQTFNSAANSGIGQLSNGASTMQGGILAYTDGVTLAAAGSSRLSAGAPVLSAGLDRYTNGVAEASDGANALFMGIETLSDGITAYTDGVGAASAGAMKIQENSSTLNNSSLLLAGGTEQLSTAGNSLLNGMQQLSSTLGEGISDEKQMQLQTLQTGLTSLHSGISQLNESVSAITMPDISTSAQILTDSASGIAANATIAGTDVTNMSKQLQSLAASHPELLTDADYLALTGSVKDCASQLTDMGAKLQTLQTAGQGLSELSTMQDTVDTLKTSVTALNTGAEQVLPAAETAITGLDYSLLTIQNAFDRTSETPEEMGLIQAMTIVSNGLDSISAGAKSLEDGITKYTAGVDSVSDGLAKLNSNSPALSQGTASLKSGAAALDDGLKTIHNSSPSLTDGFQAYHQGVTNLNDGLLLLTANSKALNDGIGQLTQGIGTLNSSLTAGVGQLEQGAEKLSEGTQQLVNHKTALTDGVSQLSEGADRIHDGTQQLADGSLSLGKGIDTLSEGAKKLQTALEDGAEEISTVSADAETYAMFSSPVKSFESFCTEVPTNGNAMAAYMMAVGLWVAGLAFCIILDPRKRKIENNYVIDWAKQIVELAGLGIAQAVVMVLMLKVCNGFAPEFLGTTILVACMASVAFLLLEYTVNYCAGVIGDFLLLVFMVIQLSGCAGTYPKELSAVFYQLINPLLPFTYTVHGFRSGIASGQSITTDLLVLTVMGIISSVVLLAGFRIRRSKEAAATVTAELVTA